MNNQRQLGPKDAQAELDYDTAFQGVNELLPAMALPPGFVASAKNKRFRTGTAADRLGVMICPWMLGDGRTPWNEVYGARMFSDPNGVEWFLIAADGGVWKTRPGMTATKVALPAGVVLSAATFSQFVQCFNVIVLLRGPDYPPLACSNLDQGFQGIQLSAQDEESDLSPIPNSSYGVFYLNQLLLLQGKDLVAVSNELDYTAYLAPVNTFRINQGDTDSMVAMAGFGPQQIVMLKDQSILTVTNATSGLSAAVLTELTNQYGCAAPFSVVVYGNTLYWMSGEGVTSLQLTELNQTQTTDVRLSDPIPVTMGRINSLYLSGCVAEVWDSKLYMAVPLDDAALLRPGLVAAGQVYTTGPNYTVNLIIGRKYRFTQDPAGGLPTPGIQVGANIYQISQDFVATNATATFLGPLGQPVGAQLQLVTVGVNTGVLVYDFQQSAWCGSDESDQAIFSVKAFLKATYRGKKRLFMIGADGVLRLYEEGYEDEVLQQVATPYIDVLVNGQPVPGNTIQVSGGAVITAANSQTNAGNNWGILGGSGAANLWAGYNPAGESPWNAGTAVASQILSGVRFTGANVAVAITGNWAFADAHTGVEVASVPIQSYLLTRGYVTRSYIFANEDKKRFLMLAALMNTWNSTYTLNAVASGVGMDTNYVDNQGVENTESEIYGAQPWDPSNANDDHETPKRQDYSCTLPEPTGFNLGADGVNFDLMQNSTDRVPISEFGHWVQLEIENSQGRMEVVGIFMEAQEGEKLSGRVI